MIKPISIDNCQPIHGLTKKKWRGNTERELLMDYSAIEFWEKEKSKIKQNQFQKIRSQNYTLRFVREGENQKRGFFFALFCVHFVQKYPLSFMVFLDSLMRGLWSSRFLPK